MTATTSAAGAVGVASVDLAEGGLMTWVSPTPITSCASALVLVRSGSHALGLVRAPVAGDAVDLDAAAPPLATLPAAPPEIALPVDGPLVSVVITTCDAPADVARLLRHLAASSTYRSFEVVVVENRPGGSAVEAVCAQDLGIAVRYVEEPVAGLSRARNAGLRAARGDLVVFTDDDVTPDGRWLAWLCRAFEEVPVATCVTGQILPLDLSTPAQRMLEEYGGFSKGFARAVWDEHSRPDEPLYPFAAGDFGSGANTAWRTDALRDLGGWDERLGAGTPARGGEDLEAFVRVIQAGRVLVYEPNALVWHRHRPGMDALRRQLFSYGIGLAATVSAWLADPRTRWQVVRRIPLGLRRALDPTSQKNAARTASYPRELVLRELAGMALGPLLYARSARRWRRTRSADGPSSAAGSGRLS
jgi:GT2 family glycosyltransferase